ncbi:MAG: transcription antitermination factor NusB [Alphaproteobacteria bacterium]|nr:transcription antitermination factor NusB [Alphaproteobacteria bacterium]
MSSKRVEIKQNRSSSRLAAVQSLYLLEQNDSSSVDKVLKDFLDKKIGNEAIEEDTYTGKETIIELIPPESSLYIKIVRGVTENIELVNSSIEASLSKEWPADRIEKTLYAILRAGVYELLECPDIPARVIIKEYVSLADAFYSKVEPRFINGMLDKIAKTVRPEEFE